MRENFVNWVKRMRDEYGATVLFLDVGGEECDSDSYQTEYSDDAIVGYICPYCDEPIYWDDWWAQPSESGYWTMCPVCNANYEGEIVE